MCKPWIRSLSIVCEEGKAPRWGSVERDDTEIGLGVGEGARIDEEREPILIGVAGFLEGLMAMGVDTLVDTMFGMARWGSTEDRCVCESSVSWDSEASGRAGVSNRCGIEEGGGIVFGVSLECRGAELEGGFDGDSEAGRRCLATGRNNVPPFSGGTWC